VAEGGISPLCPEADFLTALAMVMAAQPCAAAGQP
jgi:hypothetical protein